MNDSSRFIDLNDTKASQSLSSEMHMDIRYVIEPTHPRILISAFVVRYMDSIIPPLAISKNSRLKLASEAEQPGLSLSWSETPKTCFLATRLNYCRSHACGEVVPLLCRPK